MYLTHQGQGAFWPAGQVRGHGGGPTAVTATASRPSGLQRDLGVERQVWLGTLAATRPGVKLVALHDACGLYVDHFTVQRGSASGNR
jgi:hypothetical protein